jgi:asparagine synthase (glutamine-hydrolysing)
VIDLVSGDQPMQDATGELTIVFNGEIYNYLELRREHEKEGAQFRTHSDTEVILEGYRRHGPRVVNGLRGMFAFAIWDARKQELFLARDRLGKKPLFWCRLGEVFYFASTMEAFRSLPGWSDELSRASVLLYSFLGAFPEDTTVYRQARALPSGCTARVRGARAVPQIERYWQLRLRPKRFASERSLAEEYRALLREATAQRLRADVPVALTFSGGVDSGTLAALCRQDLRCELACFTVDHHTAESPSEEVQIAQRVADRLGLAWCHVPFDWRADLLTELDEAYAPYDQPCQQIALVYSRRLYEAIKPHATVVLTGNGADELFQGYDGNETIRRDDLLRGLARLAPAWLRARLPGRAGAWLRRHDLNGLPVAAWWRQDLAAYVQTLAPDAACAEEARAITERVADAAQAAEVASLMDLTTFRGLAFGAGDTNYRLPDVSGLAAQVEVRSPFLDHRFVEFAAVLPDRLKVHDFRSPAGNKYLPKKVYAELCGAEFAFARKKGMGFNLRFGEGFAQEPRFRAAMDRALAAVEEADLGVEHFRAARERFDRDVAAGHAVRPTAGPMMQGFMLGAWLLRGRGGVVAPSAPG